MSAPDPRQTILDYLARPAGRWEPGSRSPGGIEAGLVAGGNPFEADLSTVRFVKHRESERRQVHFVTFDGSIPRLSHGTQRFGFVFPLDRDREGRWRVSGGAGGGGGMPARSTPWVNLGGGGWPDRFYAGGRIESAGIDIARVELRFANGLVLEDDGAEGVALFITEEAVRMPASVVLRDRAGNEVATHSAF